MIWLLLGMWLFGSGDVSPLVARIEQTRAFVKTERKGDPGQQEMLAALKEMDATVEAYQEQEAAASKTLGKLISRRASSASDIDAAIAQFRRQTIAAQEHLVALRFRVKDGLTREQWAAIQSGAAGSK